jgi:hypothetical protein
MWPVLVRPLHGLVYRIARGLRWPSNAIVDRLKSGNELFVEAQLRNTA